MKTEIKIITPEIARIILSKNPMNRTIDESMVFEYSRQMTAGLWHEETGESIKIATDGSLLDGQQRLLALIKSNKKLSFLLITGLEKEVFTVLDTGKKRTAGDVFHIAGVKNSRNMAAGIRKYFVLQRGLSALSEIRKLSNQEALSLYNKRPFFWDANYNMSAKWYRDSARIINESDFIAFYAFFYDIDNDGAFLFMDSFAEGTNLTNDNPIKLLREKLSFSNINPKFRLLGSAKTAYIFKTWNYFRRKEIVRILKYDSQRDNFPIPI